jgi:hypothetical protein
MIRAISGVVLLPSNRGGGEIYRAGKFLHPRPPIRELGLTLVLAWGPARARGSLVRSCVRASGGEGPACRIRRLQACIESTAALRNKVLKF